jgi:hypothetical protein
VTHRHATRLAGLGLLIVVLSACTLGDGEGPRYTGRVTSVSSTEICVGPNSNWPEVACESVPPGFTELPRVGQCVSLFARHFDQGRARAWTETSLKRAVEEDRCTQ